jgi:gamma-glutamylcyclotransferase (GGCT)/AIG2-like uncharacterized protein YtfP
LKPLIGDWRKAGDGAVEGWLYDLGEFSGGVLDAGCGSRIIGEVYEIPDDEAMMAALDGYEGIDPLNEQACLFARRRCQVSLVDGRRIESWIYVYNQPVTSAELIASGDYLTYKQEKRI